MLVVEGLRDPGGKGRFRFKIDPVLRVGNPASPLQQRLDTAFLDRVAIAVKRIA